jgi:hypothetical protein
LTTDLLSALRNVATSGGAMLQNCENAILLPQFASDLPDQLKSELNLP